MLSLSFDSLSTVEYFLFGKNMRRMDIEHDLQNALDNGHNVWAIGDVHGFPMTLEALLDQCEVSRDDRVVLLGDLIDRGPDSYDVVRIARSDPRIQCIKGNHEDMMVSGCKLESLSKPNSDMVLWLHNGGFATIASYIRAFTNDFGQEDSERLLAQVEDDKEWMQRLPSHLILDQWRLVHAGYDPRLELEHQEESIHLWIRRPFHSATKPIDKHRTVLFGHTPTMSLNHFMGSEGWGKPWYSITATVDGRSASIGLDTCVFHEERQPALLTAFNLQTHEVRQIQRVERWDSELRELANQY